MSNRKQISQDPRKRNFDLNINDYQDVNNIQRDTITANAVLHQHPYSAYPSLMHRQHDTQNIPSQYIGYPALSPSASASTSASSIFSAQPRYNDHSQIPLQSDHKHHHTQTYHAQHPYIQRREPLEMKQVYQYSEAEQKFQFHYNLLIFMRHPQQYEKISYDASISAIFILIWCAFNMIFGLSANENLRLISIGEADSLNIEKLYQRQEIFHNLVVFGIAVLNIHKDIILCNAQLCLPMLLLFNFTVRFSIQYLIKFEISWDSVNFAFILILLWFMCCRFFFNIFGQMDIHWNLMRCHFFYRGFYIRWMAYLIYSWFNALMVLQLMDSVCLSDGTLQSKLCKMHRIKFIGCDMVIVVYCIMVLGIWNKLQMVNEEKLKRYKLSVSSHGVQEMIVFIGMLVMVNFICETFLSRLIVKKMLLPVTVVVILVANFLMR